MDDILQCQHWLAAVGFDPGPFDGLFGPQTERAVARFQEAWTFEHLAVDGDPGPATQPALEACANGGGLVSAHFRVREFADRRTGEVRVLRGLVEALERLRALDGEPLQIVSGFRSRDTNAAVGGAAHSQHLVGAAADIPAKWTSGDVVGLEAFSGVGWDAANDLVIHVDVRHLGEWPDGSTPAQPSTWTY